MEPGSNDRNQRCSHDHRAGPCHDEPGFCGCVPGPIRAQHVDLCQSLWDVLRGKGYRVCLAHDALEAAEQLRGCRYRVVLIDMKLPRGDGGSVFQLVRSTHPEARVVLITGHRGELQDLVQHVVSAGADAVCYKPFDMPRLLETGDQLAGSREERRRAGA